MPALLVDSRIADRYRAEIEASGHPWIAVAPRSAPSTFANGSHVGGRRRSAVRLQGADLLTARDKLAAFVATDSSVGADKAVKDVVLITPDEAALSAASQLDIRAVPVSLHADVAQTLRRIDRALAQDATSDASTLGYLGRYFLLPREADALRDETLRADPDYYEVTRPDRGFYLPQESHEFIHVDGDDLSL